MRTTFYTTCFTWSRHATSYPMVISVINKICIFCFEICLLTTQIEMKCSMLPLPSPLNLNGCPTKSLIDQKPSRVNLSIPSTSLEVSGNLVGKELRHYHHEPWLDNAKITFMHAAQFAVSTAIGSCLNIFFYFLLFRAYFIVLIL
jgi:hypothetical protein